MNRVILGVASLALVVAACGDDDAGTTVATTTPAEPAHVIAVTIRAGSIGLVVDGATLEPGDRVNVASGDLIQITTSGDEAEEVHIHGYDLAVEITPGTTETAEFAADIPGIFEVELEGAGTLLFELEVS